MTGSPAFRERRRLRARIVAFLLAFLVPFGAATAATPVLRVAYAGSMGTVMDGAVGPQFAARHGVRYQGTGQGSWALARLLAGKQIEADVFIGITRGPVDLLREAGLLAEEMPVARTHMVLIHSPRSRFAPAFAAVAAGERPWHEVLRGAGLRLGRTDPAIDPQGANALFVLQLAAGYYDDPELPEAIAGPLQNPRQIFTETSLMSRIEAGQIDAAIGYLSTARSHGLPTIELPDAINLGDLDEDAPPAARLLLADGRELQPQPLVFHAAVLATARDPRLAREFIAFLSGPEGQALLREHGYAPPAAAP